LAKEIQPPACRRRKGGSEAGIDRREDAAVRGRGMVGGEGRREKGEGRSGSV
jgi:hypothetical protein